MGGCVKRRGKFGRIGRRGALKEAKWLRLEDELSLRDVHIVGI